MRRFFSSESVTEGHPDKVCDRIADTILDELIKGDSETRAAVECCAAYNTLFITGEVTSRASVDYSAVARKVVREIGYTTGDFAFDKCNIIELSTGRRPILRSASIRPSKTRRGEKQPTASAQAIRA